MRYDAIYFDLDGTLWDTTDLTFDSANKIAEKYDLPAVPREKIEECMGKTKDECADLLYPEFSHEQALEYLEEALDLTTQKLLIQGGKVYDGLEDTLKELVNRGYKLGIVSNCLEGYIEAFMISSRRTDAWMSPASECRDAFVDRLLSRPWAETSAENTISLPNLLKSRSLPLAHSLMNNPRPSAVSFIFLTSASIRISSTSGMPLTRPFTMPLNPPACESMFMSLTVKSFT